MRKYEVMVILDPDLEERTVQPSLETFLNVVRGEGGTVDNVDIWGRRRLAYDIRKMAEAQPLPEYGIRIERNGKHELVILYRDRAKPRRLPRGMRRLAMEK